MILPGFSRLNQEDQAGLTAKLCGYFCANVGFGPYVTEALRLRGMYNFTMTTLNTEILAGVFEQTLRVLERAGLDVLIKHLVMWCVGCVLYRLSAGRDNFLEDLNPKHTRLRLIWAPPI